MALSTVRGPYQVLDMRKDTFSRLTVSIPRKPEKDTGNGGTVGCTVESQLSPLWKQGLYRYNWVKMNDILKWAQEVMSLQGTNVL